MDSIQNIINRLKTAADTGRGVRLSYTDVQTLRLTSFGESWDQSDPRTAEGVAAGAWEHKLNEC